MTDGLEKLRNSAKEFTDNLARLGKELSEIQFHYKIIENATEQYWKKRIDEFKKFNEVGIEYYTQAHALMSLIDKEQSGLFLLSTSKLHQIGLRVLTNMEEIKKNPSIIKSKDKQQSKWSKEIREKMIESNDTYMNHERYMNRFFREFYEKHLKNILSENNTSVDI